MQRLPLRRPLPATPSTPAGDPRSRCEPAGGRRAPRALHPPRRDRRRRRKLQPRPPHEPGADAIDASDSPAAPAGSPQRLAHLPGVGRPAARQAHAACRGGRQPRRPAGRGGGAGRRIRLRQDHAGAHAARAAGAVGRRDPHRRAGRRTRWPAARSPRWCSPCSRTPTPRSIRASRSAPSSRCPLRVQRDHRPRDLARARRGHDGARRPGAPALRQLSEPALGRPAPARRHRPRADQRAAPGDLRRADLGARRLRAVADPEPAAGPAPRPRPHLSADQPQPRRGRAHGDARRRHVSRAHRRGGARRSQFYRAPRHPYSEALLGLRAHARAGPRRARHAAGRRLSQPAGRAARVPLPSPLRARHATLRARCRPKPIASDGGFVECHLYDP